MSAERCAIVDASGNVTNIVMADPSVDSFPNHSLIVSDSNAFVGGTYINGTFSSYQPSEAATHAMLVYKASSVLKRSDNVVIRCYSANVVVPASWQAYRAALRAIVNGSDTTSTALPTEPSYPAGT